MPFTEILSSSSAELASVNSIYIHTEEALFINLSNRKTPAGSYTSESQEVPHDAISITARI
jgi:hypothetical protein